MVEYQAYHLTISSYSDSIKSELIHSSANKDDCTAVAYQKACDFIQDHIGHSCNWGIIPLPPKWVVYNLYNQDIEIFYACRKDGDKDGRARHQHLESR